MLRWSDHFLIFNVSPESASSVLSLCTSVFCLINLLDLEVLARWLQLQQLKNNLTACGEQRVPGFDSPTSESPVAIFYFKLATHLNSPLFF